MNQKNILSDKPSTTKEKIYTIADEVLDVLKQLSRDNKQQLNTKLIAERMYIRDTVKNIFEASRPAGPEVRIQRSAGKDSELKQLKNIIETILDRFSDNASPITDTLDDLNSQFYDKSVVDNPAEWINSTVSAIKRYIDSISVVNEELGEFMQQTVEYLSQIEDHLLSEISSNQKKFDEDREFENSISVNIDMIKEDFDSSGGLRDIKKTVISKIENINKNIGLKRKHDMLRLRETEKTLREMGARVHEIKKEADEIKEKARQMELESLTDRLTGLHNRKAYDCKMTETLANLDRYDVPASLLICDIDFFKKVNDNHGHKVGDLALKKIAKILKDHLRVNDFIARYGGEEFAVILPHTDLQGGVKAAEGIRSYIDKSVFYFKNRNVRLTVSIGVSLFKKGDNPSTVFERADSALYMAKRTGRNLVKTENDLVSENAGIR